MLNKTLISQAGVADLILRIPIGFILAAHGGQKLFGRFGGFDCADIDTINDTQFVHQLYTKADLDFTGRAG